jgi:hypothetical protein
MTNPDPICSLTYDPTRKAQEERENWTDLVPGMWAQLRAGIDKNGRRFIFAAGDDYSDRFYLTFCPCCGRKL